MNAYALASAHAITLEDAQAYVVAAQESELLAKQACILRSRGCEHAEVFNWLLRQKVGQANPEIDDRFQQILNS